MTTPGLTDDEIDNFYANHRIPTTGDAVMLYQSLLQATWMGLVGDPDTPPMVGATMEAVDGKAVITTTVLIGPRGFPGKNAPMIELHWPVPLNEDDEIDLPTDWGPEQKNHGFLHGGLVYVWDGVSDFHAALPGPQGKVGATPNITFDFETIPMSERTPEVIAGGDQVIQGGTPENPYIKIRALTPQGEQGEMGPVEQLTNYDPNSAAGGKTAGKALTVLPNGKWGPSDLATKTVLFGTIPEAAFSNFSGLAQRAPILSYQLPVVDFDYVLRVSGHFKSFGVELDSDPLTIGCEVRLNDPLSGQLIGRGKGNISSWTQVGPHFSEPSAPTVAAAPDNGVGLVPAGTTAVIHIALVNDGLLGAYIFNRKDAQLDWMMIPQ
ncbi:minor tail protein [Mycobacterium phage Guo1]|uniref:minor tail protein n=1 Tax=Mycobacterium phage Leo TaxID=1327952 RepID=UPI00032B7331|nr:minor tail protein [Mycobacterium phage Leo]AGK85925.1 minor tail protein [Mycobacterium phage Chy3]AGK86320.1 minor tail protein [Mycobacterium phage Leo]AID18424.1 minor tail protein [Mycobacterium phage Guo1]